MLLQSLGHFKVRNAIARAHILFIFFSLDLQGLLYRDDGVIIDDGAFKLHYAFTSYLLLFASFLVTGKVYLGSPIQVAISTGTR